MTKLGGKKIRVMVVDDSFFMKKLLSELLLSDGNIEVVGLAKDGLEAVQLARQLRPDVITMDYNMPLMNGVEAVREILANDEAGQPKIIMVSAYTGKESETALAALRAGAVDFVQKPSGELSFDIEKIKDVLLQKIHVATNARVVKFSDYSERRSEKLIEKNHLHSGKIVIIGASTGGPPMIEEILKSLPANFPAAIMIVQHMPNYFTGKFAERLDHILPFNVKLAKTGDMFKVGEILVVPAEDEIVIEDNQGTKVIHLVDQGFGDLGIHPSIDRTMTEIAKSFTTGTVGVILTGMGDDGLIGMAEVIKKGGFTIAQDPDTAVISSMPNAIIKSKLADEVLSPDKIGKRLVELVS